MKPNKDDIIKAIETRRSGLCDNCPYEHIYNCLDVLCGDTVKFINELTVENEEFLDTIACLEIDLENAKTHTVKKALAAIKSRSDRHTYSCMISGDIRETYTISGKALDEIEKELLEDEK